MILDDFAAGNLFVTGELGAGKTMWAVKLIREYLQAGRPVATNLNLYLDEMMPLDSKASVIRIPDKPLRQHFDQLGDAYPCTSDDEYDESKFGLIVLDECLIWLNSRGWQDKERAPVLDWFLHARKHGWNVVFLLQNADFADPQARETLLTYHVSCRKMGKYRVPLVGKVLGLRLPKGTLATIYSGYGADAITHDREMYRGSDLYRAYQTRQVFRNGYEFVGGQLIDMRAPYSMLSSWHTKGRYLVAAEPPQAVRVADLLQSASSLIGWKVFRPLALILIFPFFPVAVFDYILSKQKWPQSYEQ